MAAAPPPPAEDTAGWPLVRVAVQAHVGLLDYAVPRELVGELAPGTPVRVQLGRRAASGYVVGPGPEAPPADLTFKPVLGLDDARPPLPSVLLELVMFAAAHYAAAPGELLAAALPARARVSQGRYVLTELGVQAAALVASDPADGAQAQPTAAADLEAGATPPRRGEARARILALGEAHPRGFALPAVRRALGGDVAKARGALQRLVARGELAPLAGRGAELRREASFVHLGGADGAVLGPRQTRARALFDLMPADEPLPLSALRQLDAQALRLVRTLLRFGLVGEGPSVALAPATRASAATGSMGSTDDAEANAGTAPTLTPAQAEALDEILAAVEADAYAAFLLFGVTGSGKTEVYLRAIEAALARGKTALVLVPEIALTPQLGQRFRARFGDEVATFHSGLSPAERQNEWERVADGRARIGLGARSALFLPLRRLGVLVVDEEHESSFKQDESPRYHARDMAVWRARAEGATVLLGSATPSLESWHNAALGRYRRLNLPDRVSSRPMPKVEIVPLQSSERVGSGLFTQQLADAMRQTFAAGDQAILFLNRRGYAPYVFCRDCGHAFRCADCDVALTLHQRRGRLVCHYCGEAQNAPDACPSCQGNQVDTFGLGTERVEEEVRLLFPQVTLARLDRDTVRRRQDLEQVLRSFRRGQAQLLVGTQMVAKGHDFPGVTLVGVVAADASLNFPDFRAAERTFQLLAQVAGRAGRGERPGRVIVQAFEHGHYAVQTAAQHDFESFAAQELRHREELDYPPHGHLVRLRYEGEDEGRTRKAAEDEAEALRVASLRAEDVPGVADVQLLGPAPAPLARLRGQYRYHILLKGPSRSALRTVLAGLPRRAIRGVRTIVDVDPVNML